MSEELLIGIGDIHGHYKALNNLLNGLEYTYHIFENREQLILKENVKLVTTGDYIDRGNENLKVLETIMKLNADKLFGNHELLALGELDTLNAILEYAQGEEALQQYRKTTHGANGGISLIKEFASEPMEALTNYSARLSREGDIGAWMRTLQPFKLHHAFGKKILFVHGGIPDSIASAEDLASYEQQFTAHLSMGTESFRRQDATGARQKYRKHPLVDGHSIFWDRQIPTNGSSFAKRITDRLGLDYIVIGHTPHERIENYGNRIFNIDVGMTPAYGENPPSAIVFKPSGVFEFSLRDGELPLVLE